jgi:hypothetical protein
MIFRLSPIQTIGPLFGGGRVSRVGKTMQPADQRGYPETREFDRAPVPFQEQVPDAEAGRRFIPRVERGRLRRQLRRKQRAEARLSRRRRKHERRIARRRRGELKSLERQLIGRRHRRWPIVPLPRPEAKQDLSELESMIAAAAARAMGEERERLAQEFQQAVERRLREVSQKFARWQHDSEERVRAEANRTIEEAVAKASEDTRAALEREVERRVGVEVSRMYPRLERSLAQGGRGRR